MALFSTEDSHLLNLEKTSLFFFASLESKTKYTEEYSSQLSVEWWSFVCCLSKSPWLEQHKNGPEISKKGKIPLPCGTLPLLRSQSSLFMLAVSPGEMDVPVQHHRKAVIIISRSSHGSQHSCSGSCPGRHRVWKVSSSGGAVVLCSSLTPLPTAFCLWGKGTEFVSPSFVRDLCTCRLAQVSTSANSENFLFFFKKRLTYAYQGYQEFYSELHMDQHVVSSPEEPWGRSAP